MVDNGESLVYSVPQVQQLLRISRSSVYEAIRRRQLPVLRIGRRLLVPRAALERLIDQVGATPGTKNDGGAHDTRQRRDDEP